MEVSSFVADSVPEAVEQIRAELGSEAVVLSVRKVEAGGLARLWQKPRLEVLACRPQASEAQPGAVSQEMAFLRQELAVLKGQLQIANSAPDDGGPGAVGANRDWAAPDQESPRWRIELLLENSGLLPVQAKRVLDMVQARHGEIPPSSIGEELALTREALLQFWRQPAPVEAR